jgi:endonuclease-8
VPEGHIIHRLARDHVGLFGGQHVAVDSPQGRFSEGSARLDGRIFEGAEAFGKHLFHDYGDDLGLHVHLGLYGVFRQGMGQPPAPRGAIRVRLVAARSWAELRGPTACELVTGDQRRLIVGRLGADPLRPDADVEQTRSRVVRSRTPIAALLLQQDVFAGVGNVFRAEVLFRHAVDPFLPSERLPVEVFDAIWRDLVALMRSGVRTGGIVTTLPSDRDGRRGPVALEDRYYVYRRLGLPCRRCGSPVLAAELAGRNLYWCPTCQPSGSTGQAGLVGE